MNRDWLPCSEARSVVYEPADAGELTRFLRETNYVVSVAGAQFSSGGQTLIDDGVIISTKKMRRVSVCDHEASDGRHMYVAESGATWLDVMKVLVPLGLVPAVMQSYNSFSVGGSISVDAHGRTGGRVSDTIEWIDVALADGRVVRCTNRTYGDLYGAVVGGYGLLGVIVRAKLRAVRDRRLRCHVSYGWPGARDRNNIRRRMGSLFNGELVRGFDGKGLTDIACYSWEEEGGSFTGRVDESSIVERFVWRLGENIISSSRTLANLRLSMKTSTEGKVSSLSGEMASDATSLIPMVDMSGNTSMLQEYFVPDEALGGFLSVMSELTSYFGVNLLNVSLRLVSPGGILLDYAPGERTAVVLYARVGDWQRYVSYASALADLAVSLGGSWYLPYLTAGDVSRAYRRIGEFLEMKKKYDPLCRFRSRFYEKMMGMTSTTKPIQWLYGRKSMSSSWDSEDHQTRFSL